MLIDVHAHLDQFAPDELKGVIDRAIKNNVKVIINNGVDVRTNRITLELSMKFSIVKPALGLHPEFINKFNSNLIEAEIDFITKQKEKVVAVGEVGLDYYWVKDEVLRKKQKELFRIMIQTSIKLKKPVIVHSRKAELDTIKILEAEGAERVVLHAFGGKLKLLDRIINNGWFLSIPPSVVRSSHFQEIVKRTPLNHLLTETDAPFLSPFKNKKNEPSFVVETIKKISQLKSLTEEEVENNIFLNYQRLFL